MALAQYSELFWFPSGELAASVPARVFQHETNTLAALWADEAGTVPLANPLSTSGTGRLEFWTEEGKYWVHIDSEAFEVAVGAAAQAATQQDIANEVARADAAYAAILHAARHAAAGADPVTLSQSQVTGLVAALAALLPKAGGTVTGDLTVEGYTTLQGGQFNSDFAAFGDMTLIGTDKGFRFRRGGAATDFEGAGTDLVVSVWSGGDFTGTQRSYLRLSADAQNVQVAGKTEIVDSLYGTAVHALDPVAGTASLGAKNSLTNLRFCGFKNTTGAPTTNAWTAGDVVLDSTGTWHLCTASGTPGTWTTGPVDHNLPSEQNLLDWTYDPDMAGHVTAQSTGGVAGRITLVRHILRKQITWSNVWIGLAGVDAAASLSNCYLGVYDAAGTLKATTADISSSLMSGAVAKPLALTAPFVAAPGTYFIAMLLNGTWTTNSLTFKASGAGVSVNAGLTAPNLRYSNILTAQTSLPASLTLANQATSIINTGWASQWYGIS